MDMLIFAHVDKAAVARSWESRPPSAVVLPRGVRSVVKTSGQGLKGDHHWLCRQSKEQGFLFIWVMEKACFPFINSFSHRRRD
jgi:hypothetical protein